MKRILVAIIAILYLASTSGATINFHYCMGELVDANISSEKKEKCKKCGMPQKKRASKACCEDTHKLVKVEQGHEKGIFDMPSFVLDDVLVNYTDSYQFVPITTIVQSNPATGPPLLASRVPLYIYHCHFNI